MCHAAKLPDCAAPHQLRAAQHAETTRFTNGFQIRDLAMTRRARGGPAGHGNGGRHGAATGGFAADDRGCGRRRSRAGPAARGLTSPCSGRR
ncbi:Hypothetical protein I596_1191 [Dokdonella koreensis DS-123]|uniref:Uncharacterized protein n=1 Tax=Dokdonella koreensis DS-123 TaxID=1300342 RepID=A0A160DTD6_9GAMM|nr:Hypothetical protein I596_1191 [Dokdonella koreensis DS-123]